MKIKKPNKTNITWLLFIFNVALWVLWVNLSVAYIGDILYVAPESDKKSEISDKIAVLEPVDDDIEAYIMQEALKRNLSTYEVWAIIQCESNWNEYAINKNTNGTLDLGLWQINSIHNISRECLFDYKCATNEAFNMRERNGNWNAWTCAKKLGI